MQIKICSFLIAFWSSPLLETVAYSDCSPGPQPTVTHVNETYRDLIIQNNDSPALDHYTDQQLGIFRLTRHTSRELKRFTLFPLSSRTMLILVHSIGDPSECMFALVVSDPWNTNRVLMTTVRFDDIYNKEPFKGFNGDWISVVLTNSTDGIVNLFLCDKRESITLQPLGRMTMAPYLDVELLKVSGEWLGTCYGLGNDFGYFAEEIERFINQQPKAMGISKLIVWWLLGSIGMGTLLYLLGMNFVFRSSIPEDMLVEDKLTRAAFP